MKFEVGDLVLVCKEYSNYSIFGGTTKADSIGFIYERYRSGVSVLLEDGNDLGGFSDEESQRDLIYIGNVM